MPTQTFFNLSHEKQKKIVDAGKKEFARVQIENASIKNIVEDANIARGSFYQYFSGKEDLLNYIINIRMEQIQKTMFNLIEVTNGNLIEMFINLYDKLVDIGNKENDKKLFRKIFENLKANESILLFKNGKMNDKKDEFLSKLYEKNKKKLNINSKEELNLILEILHSITRRNVALIFSEKDIEKGRNDYIKELNYIKNGIMK